MIMGAGAGVSMTIGAGAGVSMMIGAGAGAMSRGATRGAGAGASCGGGTVQPVLRNLQQSRGAMQPGVPDPPVQHLPCPCNARRVSHWRPVRILSCTSVTIVSIAFTVADDATHALRQSI